LKKLESQRNSIFNGAKSDVELFAAAQTSLEGRIKDL
jgi:hypothetical protein